MGGGTGMKKKMVWVMRCPIAMVVGSRKVDR
jgi:hypothetical protein